MKQTAAIVLVIAVLGLIGIADKTRSTQHQLVLPSQTSAATASNMNRANSQDAGNSSTAKYKNGTYTGNGELTPYGTVQIAVVVSGDKIAGVNFLQMPSDQPESQQRTQYSEPLLKQTTINKQSANIDFVSGATATSEAYQESLQSALDNAVRA